MARNQCKKRILEAQLYKIDTLLLLFYVHLGWPYFANTPGPHLVRISFVRFPLVRSFKKFQKYSARADSSIGARTI